MTKKQRYSWAELQEIAGRHGIIVTPPPAPARTAKPDPDVAELKAAIADRRRAKTTPAVSSARREQARTDRHYLDGQGRELNLKTGQWIERDHAYWEREARQQTFATVIEVRDVPGPTVTTHPTLGRIVQRGCLVCGDRMVARPDAPVRFGRWRGSMCPTHHSIWESLTVKERGDLGLFVARVLWSAGRLPSDYPKEKALFGVHPINAYPSNWKRYTWGFRVFTAEDPSIQEPGHEPWFFLSPGPVQWAAGVDPQEGKA